MQSLTFRIKKYKICLSVEQDFILQSKMLVESIPDLGALWHSNLQDAGGLGRVGPAFKRRVINGNKLSSVKKFIFLR